MMVDYKKYKPEDFSIQVDPQEIIESGDRIVFAVDVYLQSEKVFTRQVPIRREFYHALKETDAWEAAILKILKSRVRDELAQRSKQQALPIADKIKFLDRRETLS